jgi:thioredoxin reductase
VEHLAKTDGGFLATLEGGETLEARYVILSEGKGPRLAKEIGLAPNADGAIEVDRNGRSAVADAYVVGRSVRPGRSQAIISAGDGAAAAIDILSREKGEPFSDWDSPPEEG